MSEWANLCGTDGKVKATLNRRTGELRIKDHGEIHHWKIFDAIEICSAIVRQNIGFRDIRDRRKEIEQLRKDLGG